MKRRDFFAALAAIVAAPNLLAELKPQPFVEDLVEDLWLNGEHWRRYYDGWLLIDDTRPDRVNRGIIINISAT